MDENELTKKIYSAGCAGTITRKNNDNNDEFVIFYEKEPEGIVGASNLYVLTDGLAGTWHPEVVAKFAGKKILYSFFKSHDFVDANKLALAIRDASNEIYDYAKVQEEIMGSSVVAASVTEGKIVIGSVGDCRVYMIRNGKVFQITEDQNILEEKVRKGEITRDEAFTLTTDGPLTRSIGSEKDVVIDVYDGIEVKPNDILLLCSKGLISYVGKKEILEAAQADTTKEIVSSLLGVVSKAENKSDASVIAVKIYDENSIQTVIRNESSTPVLTDLNKETKDFEMIRKSKTKSTHPAMKKTGMEKLPFYIIGGLLICLVAVGAFWLSTSNSKGGSLFGPKETATMTVDPVQATLAVIQQTAQAEQIAMLSATPTFAPLPTLPPVVTEVPEYIDLDSADSGTQAVLTETIQVEPTETQISSTPVPEDKEPIISEIDQAEMVYVKAGNFLLGSESVYAAGFEESPQVEVYLDSFWIDETEVTNARYAACVEAGSCEESSYMTLRNPDYAELPVTYVTWENAKTYCEWAGKRLPTEIEWEKAARGSDGLIYPWGDENPTDENKLANIPYYVDAESGQSAGLFKVGSFPDGASPYGALDMAGNVWEWTSSYYDSGYYQTLSDKAAEDGDAVENPTGATEGTAYVIRGGSAAETEVNNYLSYTRTTNRGYVNMSSSYYIGFRCAMSDTE
ncbi:MAG: SUMF1/EgtB/PvdO family nonheme iron enzyme [Flexilinea sp.]